MIFKLKTTSVWEKNYEAYQDKTIRIILNQGGTGSSKSYSLAQLFTVLLTQEKNCRFTIARKYFPALRATAMRDFFNILKENKIYREAWHNRSEHIYYYLPTNSEVEFISIDDAQKVRSRRRNYLWINEANELSKEDFEQLNMRTDRQIFLDYNPSNLFHWIYDDLEPRKDCKLIISTFRDNPFLPDIIVKEILNYQTKDKNYWKVYGLGEKGSAETLIYKHWTIGDRFTSPDSIFYGLDFGYNNPTALLKIEKKDNAYYWEEVLYERYLTNQDLISRLNALQENGKLIKDAFIYSDTEPARIEEIKKSGFNIQPAFKGEIKDGIDFIKSHDLIISRDSVNLQKEIKSYSWKEKDGKPLEEPVKENDHLLDAGRYGVMSDYKSVLPGFDF